MSEISRPAVEEQPQIGSYFVANYPPFSVWTKEDVERAARPALAKIPEPDVPLGLYLHIPFCRSMCLYCGCHTTVTARDEPVARYLADVAVDREPIGPFGGRLCQMPFRAHSHL